VKFSSCKNTRFLDAFDTGTWWRLCEKHEIFGALDKKSYCPKIVVFDGVLLHVIMRTKGKLGLDEITVLHKRLVFTQCALNGINLKLLW